MKRVITVNKVWHDIMKMLQNNACKDTARTFICGIYWDAERKTLVSTNGKTMAVWENVSEMLANELGEGNGMFTFEPKTGLLIEQDEHTTAFPCYTRVVPKLDTLPNHAELETRRKDRGATMYGMQLLCDVASETGFRFNVTFGKFITVEGKWDLYWDTDCRAVMLVHGDVKQVIMPMMR